MDMTIALLHNHYDEDHLQEVIDEMEKLGPPTIKVLDLGFDNMYQAIEGSHRLRAAEILGITPNFEFVDPNDTVGDLGLYDFDDPDLHADEVGDYENYQIQIENDEIVPLYEEEEDE